MMMISSFTYSLTSVTTTKLQASKVTPLIATVNNTQRQGSRPFSRPSSAARNSNRLNSSGPRNTSGNQQNSGHMNHYRTNRNNFFCHFCNIPGHDTKVCRKLARILQDHNILLKLDYPFFIMLTCHSIFGLTPFKSRSISSIDYQHKF